MDQDIEPDEIESFNPNEIFSFPNKSSYSIVFSVHLCKFLAVLFTFMAWTWKKSENDAKWIHLHSEFLT